MVNCTQGKPRRQTPEGDGLPPIAGEGVVPLATGGGAGAGAGAGAVSGGAWEAVSPLSLLISRHMFHEGEIIELVIRSSAWWIILTSWRTLLFALILVLAGFALDGHLPGSRSWYLELGIMIGLFRLMWATVRWMARLHILTNMRVMTLAGVFNVTLAECPLRRLARVRSVGTLGERMLLTGSLELIPMDEAFPITLWQTVRRPTEVERKIRAAMQKAQSGGKSD